MDFFGILLELLRESGFAALTWRSGVMLVISFVLMYLAIVKGFEPLLLLPIAFGIFMSNLPLADTFKYFYEIDHWYEAASSAAPTAPPPSTPPTSWRRSWWPPSLWPRIPTWL